MPDVPEQAVWLAADALCALHDLDPIWARTLAAAALQAAAPIIAEARGAAECEPARASVTPPAFAAANARRTREAGHRDAGAANMILARFGPDVTRRQLAVARAKIQTPEASWSEIGQRLGMTKDQAAGVFYRLLRKAERLAARAR